uniref:Transcriptional regulator n=1 Tax=candidate division WOR-3 bacterium TaxID=2052148 RepID=A0A7V3RI74_UNCW3
MKLNQLKEILKANILTSQISIDIEINNIIASDLMSDVLNSKTPAELLVTGLTNNQVVRTCEIAGIKAIIFVRGKTPDEETIKLAESCKIPLLSSNLSMFEACGLLYSCGLGKPKSEYGTGSDPL